MAQELRDSLRVLKRNARSSVVTKWSSPDDIFLNYGLTALQMAGMLTGGRLVGCDNSGEIVERTINTRTTRIVETAGVAVTKTRDRILGKGCEARLDLDKLGEFLEERNKIAKKLGKRLLTRRLPKL